MPIDIWSQTQQRSPEEDKADLYVRTPQEQVTTKYAEKGPDDTALFANKSAANVVTESLASEPVTSSEVDYNKPQTTHMATDEATTLDTSFVSKSDSVPASDEVSRVFMPEMAGPLIASDEHITRALFAAERIEYERQSAIANQNDFVLSA